MQSYLKLTLPPEMAAVPAPLAGFNALQINLLIAYNAEQIAYMLQSYYSREKVSAVQVNADSISLNSSSEISLKLEYVMEEFNACSAVDTLNKDKMTVKLSQDQAGDYVLTGEYWPERSGEF